MSSFLTTCYELINVDEGLGWHIVINEEEMISPEQIRYFNSILREENANLSEIIHLHQIIVNDPTLKDQDLLNNLLFYIDQFPVTITLMVRILADRMDCDELVDCMISRLICLDWSDNTQLWKTCLIAIESFELYGKALEKTTKEKDWMLYIPFLANQMKKALHKMPDMIREKGKNEQWNKMLVTLTNCFLDMADFLNESVTETKIQDFPIFTMDIGKDRFDTRRRYLAYYILNMVYDKVISNLDLKLSDKYYKRFHPEYTVTNPSQKEGKTSDKELRQFKLVYRTIRVSDSCGCSFDRLYHIYTTLGGFLKPVPEDELSLLNDRQMINSRMYPLSPIGISTLYAISLYAAVVGSGPTECHLFPTILESVWTIKNMGVYLVDLLNSAEPARLDKALLIMLYFVDDMSDATLTLEAIDTVLHGYTGSGISVPVSRFLEMVATMASSCPDSSIRFYSYQLIQGVLKLSDDHVRVFILNELLERCPYPSMHTAAIGLLKDQIHRSFEQYEETKEVNIFTSPLIVEKFFSLIFKYKRDWKEDKAFWDDYNYIMQALNLYFFILIRDKSTNLTTIWSTKDKITKDYLKPVQAKVEGLIKTEKTPLGSMQLEIMLEVITKINNL